MHQQRVLLPFGDAGPASLPYVEPMARMWRFFAAWGLDVLIVSAAAASAVGTLLRDDAYRPSGAQLWFEVVALSAGVLLLCARRRFTFLAPALFWIISSALSFLDGRLITSQPGVFLSAMGASVLLGSLSNGLKARAGLVLVVVGSAVVVYNEPSHGPGDFLSTLVLFAVGWLIGFALRERNMQAEAAEERALRAERELESAARLAVAEERARMARELHDVVAHAVSVMVLQVGAVRHRMPSSAYDEREALGNVEEAGRTALAEMRRLLGALRNDSDEPELTPHPGLEDLDALAKDVRAVGLDVRLHVEGEPVAVSHGLDLSAYRIVQEGLTNAVKHAGAHRVDVTVLYAPSQLRLEVRDDGHGGSARNDGLGHGLIGIGERVKIYGGEMSAFASTSGGFVLRVSLPLGEGQVEDT